MKVTIKFGTPSLLERGDMVWEVVAQVNVKNLIIEVENEDGDVVLNQQLHDPHAHPYMGIPGMEDGGGEEADDDD